MLEQLGYENIPISFYQQDDVVNISREIIGTILFHDSKDGLVGGRIVETEAYNGRMDKACHAYQRRTRRTEVIYRAGGCAYIYLCYGIHRLFNIVTNRIGMADAVLIRAVEPLFGLDLMRKRIEKSKETARMASGPGLVGKTYGFRIEQTGESLVDNIWLGRETGINLVEVEVAKRIGVNYAGEDANLPWRFKMKGNNFVSKK